jgi:AcrR family transcriptional regulator
VSTREELIRCALKELETKGLENFSLRAVGANAGLSAMAVYRHFANRDELLRVLAEDAFNDWRRRVTAIREPDFKKWISKLTRAYVNFALDEPARFDACFVLKTHVERIYPEDFRAGKSPVISLSMQRISEAQQRGELLEGDPLEIAMLFWAHLHGLVMLHRSGRFSLPRSQFVSLCLRCSNHVLRGLQP